MGTPVRLILICVGLLLSLNASAVKVSDLYRVSIAVDDQSVESREAGIQLAFQQLLIKVSGYQKVLANEALVGASKDAQRLMQGYSYQADDVDGQVYLEVWFSKALVLPLMRRAKAPIWGENRPLITTWLAVEQEQQRELVSEQSPEWQARFSRYFSERGLPVVWPINDLEDQTTLPIEQLWWLFPEAIQGASERYQGDTVLAGRLSALPDGSSWQYEGLLFEGDAPIELLFNAETPEAALNLATEKVAQLLADQFAIKPGTVESREGLQIVVSKVDSFARYAALLAYLERLPGVRGVEVAQIDKDRVELFLQLGGDWAKVQRNIQLGHRLNMLQEKEFEWVR